MATKKSQHLLSPSGLGSKREQGATNVKAEYQRLIKKKEIESGQTVGA
jgi:hypothetical protein